MGLSANTRENKKLVPFLLTYTRLAVRDWVYNCFTNNFRGFGRENQAGIPAGCHCDGVILEGVEFAHSSGEL